MAPAPGVLFAALLAACAALARAQTCQLGSQLPRLQLDEAGTCFFPGNLQPDSHMSSSKLGEIELSLCKTRSKTIGGQTTNETMDKTKVDARWEEWANPSSSMFKVKESDIGIRYLDCSQIATGSRPKDDGTLAASICGYLQFASVIRYFGCSPSPAPSGTDCTYAAEIEKATADTQRGGHFIMRFPACESMKEVYTAICKDVTAAQIDTYIASQRITGNGTSWITNPPCPGNECGRFLETKCRNELDGGYRFSNSNGAEGGGGGSAPSVVLCGSGQTDSGCEHCSTSDELKCNSKDCSWDAATNQCAGGYGVITTVARIDTNYAVIIPCLTLPSIKKSDFESLESSVRDNLIKAIASAANTMTGNVIIEEISEVTQGVQVKIKILANDEARAQVFLQTLKSCHDTDSAKCKIDGALEREGLAKSSELCQEPYVLDAGISSASFRGASTISLLLAVSASAIISIVCSN